jgi:hypothetical protein
VSAENAVKNTDLDYKSYSDDEKMDIAEAAAKYGVNEAGVKLEGDELKAAISYGLRTEGKIDLAKDILGMGTDDIAQIKSFGDSIREATEASNIYADELLANVSKSKYDGLTSELAGDDAGLKLLMDNALIAANDNLIDEDALTNKANKVFDFIEDKGNRNWDTMSDGELGLMNTAAEKVAGEGFDLSNAANYQKYFGEGISTDLATKLASGENVETKDLLQAVYEA